MVGVAELPETLSTATHEVSVSTLLAPKKAINLPSCRGFNIAALVHAFFATTARAQMKAVRDPKFDIILPSGRGGMSFGQGVSQVVSRAARYRALADSVWSRQLARAHSSE